MVSGPAGPQSPLLGGILGKIWQFRKCYCDENEWYGVSCLGFNHSNWWRPLCIFIVWFLLLAWHSLFIVSVFPVSITMLAVVSMVSQGQGQPGPVNTLFLWLVLLLPVAPTQSTQTEGKDKSQGSNFRVLSPWFKPQGPSPRVQTSGS